MNEQKLEDVDVAASQEKRAIPMATTQPNVGFRFGKVSHLWWLTVLSLLAAIGLVWWSLPSSGVALNVTFPEGHGLKAEDLVLYRGIKVGHVEEVKLSNDLSGISVLLQLNESSAQLARAGTQFWIVRPKLSITEISGLETAVGHKYVSLKPGPKGGARQLAFEGLINAPVLDSDEVGVEIVIRGDRRSSVNTGSPVNFRGVEVGRVMSVGLSPDSRYVDIRARIFERHSDYLTTSSRFWANAGVDVDFSLGKGLSVDTESLATLAQGGISFLTINNGGDPISPGHIFKLFDKAEDEWLLAANQVAATNIELGGVTTLVKSWRQKGLLGKRRRDLAFNGVPVVSQNKHCLIVPAEAISRPAKAVDDQVEFLMLTKKAGQDISALAVGAQALANQVELSKVSFSQAPELDWRNQDTDFRQPEYPEDVFAVRATIEDGKLVYLHYFIDKTSLHDDWTLPTFDGDEQLWHGSPVMSAKDGKVLGVLFVQRRATRVIQYSPDWFAE